jgi:4-hydroxyphenylpyruvate dioxygenase
VLDPKRRAQKLQELQLWFDICKILGTDIIQIPCTYETEGVTGDLDVVASDLQEIAELGAQQQPPFRFAFENLCFGTFFDTWKKAWDVVTRVDRPNFGLCLDTYNIAGREYADPSLPTGKVLGAETNFQQSIRTLAQTIDVKKVFYVQVVDGERLNAPLDENHPFHVEGQKPRMSWSRNARLFICEEDKGGYLPVVDIVKAITDKTDGLGYTGWISMELFNRSLTEKNEDVPRLHAERAMRSWRTLNERMGWVVPNLPKFEGSNRSNTENPRERESEVIARL